ncbi:MAG TPA: aminotransferase class III-fold pyridoxal phosphate-dependent enzyme [Solirubrobacterales bacterium]
MKQPASTEAVNAGQPYPSREEVAARFAGHVNRGKVAALQAMGVDIVIGEREGARFRDAYSGRWFWNCHCNGGVFNLGHRHPAVVAALREALDHLDVGNHHLLSGWRARLAEQLAGSTEGRLPYLLFTPSGSEAVDLALTLARGHTGREKIVAATGAYHGLAGFARAASDARWSEPYGEPIPGFAHVPFNDLDRLAAELEGGAAAVILESIPATLGFPPPAPGYLREAGDLARRQGALLVLDEVQTGLGRTGTPWFYQQEQAEPDILITGKGLGGGLYPVSAALISEELEGFFDRQPFAYVSTFGGSELGCVTASAVMREVSRPEFMERVRALAERFQAGFEDLPFKLRRRGLTMGLAFDQPQGGVEAAKKLIDAGVFAVFAEHDHSVTQFKPPLILADGEAEEIIETVRHTLG